jgi:putative membrane protein insertion efficiency factor
MNAMSTRVRPSPAARLGIALVRFYQRFLSALKPPTCRFHPSCSEYAAQAIAHRGLLRGCLLAAWRLLRCNPFSAGGWDPGPWAAPPAHRPNLPPESAAGEHSRSCRP